MDVTDNAEIKRENLCLDERSRKMEKSSPERRHRSSCSMEKIEEKSSKCNKRRRFVNARLPTPPPDPSSRQIFNEGMVPYENSASKAAARALGVEDAFNHLDKLHSMMKEILEIRERNAKLFRRVRHLERLKVTRKAHLEAERLISMGQDVVLPDEDVGFAESLLGAMLSSSFELSASRNSVGRSVGLARVGRSRSIGIDNRRVSCPLNVETRQRVYNRSAPRSLETKGKRPSLAIGTPKVSKWTRVKAAFKWERAACSNTDATAIEPEVNVRYLKIPENTGGSSEISGPPTPAGTMSSSSSIDDVFHRSQRVSSNQSTRITRRDENSDPSRRSRSLDGDASVPMNFVYSPRPRSKDNSSFQGKSVDSRIHKTPWGKVKDMMQLRRESIGRLPARSISRNDDGHSTSSLDSSDIHRSEQQGDGRPPRVRITGESNAIIVANMSKSGSSNVPNDFMDLASRRLTPTLTITVPSSEELRSISSPESITPSPPSPRQSFESGKSERYSQGGYETPKEIRTGQVSPASSSSGILRYGLGRSKTCQGVPFNGDYKRQQSLKGESLGSSPKMQRRDSKWNKVKRAFLTSATSVPTSPNRVSSYFFDDGDATGGSYSASASAEDLENQSATSPGVQAEAERNYRLLHDKFGAEFYRKLAEWERLKSNNASSRDSSSRSNARERDNENLRLLGEERLTPEFKKKLEEWKRMNKGSGEARGSNGNENRSANRRRITDWQLWRSPSKPENKTEGPRLSDDFIKKMDEWKRMKAATSRRETEIDAAMKTRGQRPESEEYNEEDEDGEEEEDEVEEDKERLLKMGLSGKRLEDWKSLEDEEFRSLEMVLETMEMDRQTRLSKLQRIVGSQPQRTQEVLIHTSTGLYRFEGISQKFTRKLYEWEKSQGISPELSTFRLLDPLRYGVGSHHARTIAVDVNDDGAPRRNRHRSKSVGCGDIDSWRTKRENEKTTIRRPCSLSLNDVDNIDPTGCIIASSIPTIPDEEDTSEDIAMEDSEAEPEAVIVDIEDVIEETASPLRKYQPHQTPVYSVAGSETTSIAIPLGTVTARHEPSPIILIEPGEVHPLRGRACSINDTQEEQFYANEDNEESVINVALPSSSIDDQQRNRSTAGIYGTKRNDVDADEDELSTEGIERNDKSHLSRIADRERAERQEDSDGTWQMAPLSRGASDSRVFLLRERSTNDEDEPFEDAIITARSNARHSKKLPKTRRLTDAKVGYDWLTRNELEASNNANDDLADGRDNDTNENSLAKINDEFADNPNVERIIINADTLNKIVVPTASSSSALSATLKLDEDDPTFRKVEDSFRKEKKEATSVFVKTKRIVFSPFRREIKTNTMESSQERATFHKANECFVMNKSNDISVADRSSSISNTISESREFTNETEQIALSPGQHCFPSANGPFLPRSPNPARKVYAASSTREKSPGVRMMVRRYNELDIDNCDRVALSFSPIPIGMTTSSATSSRSGSSSPGWRTPLTERKWINRTDRYEEAKKAVTPRRIGKDFSVQSRDRTTALLSKSSSVDFSRQRSNLETRRERTMEPEFLTNSSSIRADSCILGLDGNSDLLGALSTRAMKIRRAKENFLSMGKPRDAMEERNNDDDEIQPGCSSDVRADTRNGRIEEKRSSIAINDIVKAVSVGMINVDEDTYGRLRKTGDDVTERGSDSLPPLFSENLSHTEMRKGGSSRLSQIANKFKRARLRRAKERESSNMSTVFKLCRQTLLVDIANTDSGRKNKGENSRSQTGSNESTNGKNERTDRKNNNRNND